MSCPGTVLVRQDTPMNEKQQHALDLCLQGHNVLLTGGAGVGKSFCLKRIVEALRLAGKTVAVTAMTGFASVPIDGITFHSFSKIRVRFYSTEMDKIVEEAIQLSTKDAVRKNWNKHDVVVIDECSMMKPFMLDLCNHIARQCLIRVASRLFWWTIG